MLFFKGWPRFLFTRCANHFNFRRATVVETFLFWLLFRIVLFTNWNHLTPRMLRKHCLKSASGVRCSAEGYLLFTLHHFTSSSSRYWHVKTADEVNKHLGKQLFLKYRWKSSNKKMSILIQHQNGELSTDQSLIQAILPENKNNIGPRPKNPMYWIYNNK